MKKEITFILIFSNLVTSLYLLSLIKSETYLDLSQKIFIYTFFVVIGFGILYGLKIQEHLQLIGLRKAVIIALLSIFFTIIGRDIVLPEVYEDCNVEVIATGQKNDLSNSYEIWINSIETNGSKVDYSTLQLEEGWTLNNGSILANAYDNRAVLKIDIKNMKNMRIDFSKHAWSGIVEVKYKDEITTIDLYAENADRIQFEITGMRKDIGPKEIILLVGASFIIYYFISLLYVFIYKKNCQNINYVITNEILFAFMITGELSGFFDISTIVFFMILIAAAGFCYIYIKNKSDMKKYFSKTGVFLIILLDIYATFAVIGHWLFINTDKVTITLAGIITYVLGVFIFYPIMVLAIYIIKKAQKAYSEDENISCTDIRKLKRKCFFLISIPIVIISLGYYPAAMTPDGVYQWIQALGIYQINNAHPAIHTLFLRACSKIAETPYTVVFVQIILFSILWTSILGYFYKKGLKKRIVYMIAILLACTPSNYMMLCLVSKNILYAIIILWNMYLFMQMIDDSIAFLKSKIKIIEFGVALALLYTVRHNGFMGTIAACSAIIGWMVWKRKSIGFKPVFILLVMCGTIGIIKGPLYKAFNVSTDNVSLVVSGPLLQAAGIYILADEEIPVVVQETVEKIGTLEQWKESYNPYDGDKLDWSDLKVNYKKVSKDELFQLYFTLLKENPLLVIKARLNAIDILWNVIEPTEVYQTYGAQNSKYVNVIWAPESYEKEVPKLLRKDMKQQDGSYASENFLTILGNSGIKCSLLNQLTNSVFWRNGLYVIASLLICIINLFEKLNRKNLILLIPLMTLASLAIAASWQIYQYYWFFPISTVLFYLYSMKGNKV